MRHGDRLRPLQMSVTRHYRIQMFPGQIQQGLLEALQQGGDSPDFILQIETNVQGHLVIAAAGCMKTFAGLADSLGEQLLNIHMDVFGRHIELNLAGFDVRQNILQAGDNSRCFIATDNPLFP